jgi:putative transposase
MPTLSYKYRIEPNKTQVAACGEMFRDFCGLYNAGLQQRIEAYRRRGISVNYKMQADELKAVRCAAPELSRWSYTAEQQVLRRLDISFDAFFRRCREGKTPGFPRFKASARYHAATFRVGDGLTVRRKTGCITLVGVPDEIRVRWHRHLPSKPKSAILTRQNGKWYIVFHVEVDTVDRAGPDSVGIDVGLTSLIALSNGKTVSRPNWTKKASKELRRRQRAVARCKRGSKTRGKRVAALARYHAYVANRRRDHLHYLSRDLVNRFGRIAIEDLNVKGLSRGMLAKDVNDASWAQLAAMLQYKAANAGVELVRVDPRGTSQTCPECGQIKPKKRRERHRCDCGADLDRDVAAAQIVHIRAFGFRAWNRPPALCEAVAASSRCLEALTEPVAAEVASEAACFSWR